MVIPFREVSQSTFANFIVYTVLIWVSQKLILPSEKEKGIISIVSLTIIMSLVHLFLGLVFPESEIWQRIAIFVMVGIALIKKWFDIDWIRALAIGAISAALAQFLAYLPQIVGMIGTR
ncbi:MAG: hypothetical protein DRO00_02280 [Thermoproteota archaeon]|nr:MAG: hypothetical protein DRO00_02280 [Candidatus Korarchaeota archaeon]